MKKIMFNDKYGLTDAVLNGQKTMTRRIIPPIEVEWNRRGKVRLPILGFEHGVLLMDTSGILGGREKKYSAPNKYQPKFEIGEIVAVAQAYRKLYPDADFKMHDAFTFMTESEGWNNKMFVKAEHMPNRIRITDIKVERLQDISEEDCLKEGLDWIIGTPGIFKKWTFFGTKKTWNTRREAFAALIDKVSGKGTWESNPWVFAYTFELERRTRP